MECNARYSARRRLQQRWRKFFVSEIGIGDAQRSTLEILGGREVRAEDFKIFPYFVILAQDICQKFLRDSVPDRFELVKNYRVDKSLQEGSWICMLNGSKDPCILRLNGQYYSFAETCNLYSFSLDPEVRCITRNAPERFILVWFFVLS
jgi:hypothetical protein